LDDAITIVFDAPPFERKRRAIHLKVKTAGRNTSSILVPGARDIHPDFAMNKRAIIKKIIARLTEELQVYFRAAQFSRAEATHESSKAESKYDTRGLEASYLARGQSKQAAELEAAIVEFEKLAVRNFGVDEPIDLGALVELEHGGENSFYFIGPRAGGTEVLHDKKKILVITPQSPLGEQLMGKKSGQEPQLSFGGAKQVAKIMRVV
jgi:transcription elongation GreA/GreB family factor